MNAFSHAAEPLSLGELPRRSPVPAILLGTAPFTARRRTKAGVHQEYGRKKCGKPMKRVKASE
jgi:hypothetical protein